MSPAGSTALATSDTALLTVDHGESPFDSFYTTAYLGCLRADGRERLLADYPDPGYATEDVVEASLAAPYAALVVNTYNGHDQTSSSAVDLFDLRTGLGVPDRGGEGSTCPTPTSPSCGATIDQLVLGSDAVSAVHTTALECAPLGEPSCHSETVEQIQASDSAGVRTLDTASEATGSPALLTNLALAGDSLTWDNNGTQRSAQLQP